VPPTGPAIDVISNSVVDAARSTGSAPQGPAIDVVFKLSGGCYRTHRQCPQGARHRHHLQNSMVDAAGHADSAPRGAPSMSSSKLNGRRYRTHQHRPPRGLPSTSSPTSVVDTAEPVGSTPQGARHQSLTATSSHCQYPLPTHPRGALVDYYYWACYKQDISREFFLDPCNAKDSKKRNCEEDIIQRGRKQSLFTKQKMSVP
jgi:hypothetical protein